MKKKNWATLTSLIILIIVLLVVLFWSTFKLLDETSNYAEQLISVIGVAISFVGTMVLGIIAYWQTKQANTISQLVIEKDEEIDINWLSPIGFSKQEIHIVSTIEFAKNSPVEGVICSENQNIVDEDLKCLEIDFPFELKNGNIEKVVIKNIAFNKTYSDENCQINLYPLIGEKISNGNEIIVAYNPAKQNFILSFYINCDFKKLININDMKMFVLDFSLLFKSKYDLNFEYKIQANFQEIKDLDDVLHGKVQNIMVELENMLITKEKADVKSKNTKINRKKK